MSRKPEVTGISPKDGYPGTKVIIRGENLGKDENDLLAVKICGVDCTLRSKWENSKKITTYTGKCNGKGDIVVITHSGGTGTSMIGFQGLVKKNIGPTEETCVWIDEDAKSILTGLKRSNANDISLDNPLGISVEDSSNRTIIEFLDREFPNSTIDMTKESFNPMRFLLENYQSAKYENLKSGLNHLKGNIGSKAANSSDNLLKTNISSFMDAIKIMKDIYNLSAEDKKIDFSKNLEVMLKDILKKAHKIYDQDLVAKDKADTIRNSLHILETYKSLIYFPQNVDKYLKIEDYESILKSYKQANIQLNKAESETRKSKLFSQIKTDLDKKVIDTQKFILDKLVQFPSSPDEQKLLIDYYNILNAYKVPGSNEIAKISPGWHCLEEEKKWFIKLMLECRDMHIADEKVSLVLKQSDTSDSSSSSQQKQQQDSNNNNNAEAAKVQAMTLLPHERNKFIEELCEMFYDIFSDYWRLGSMYLNNLLEPSNSKSNSNSKLDAKHSGEDFYALVAEIMSTFTNIIRAAFIPHTFQQNENVEAGSDKAKSLLNSWPIKHDAKIISQILPHCLRVCRNCLFFSPILKNNLLKKSMCAMQIHSLEIPVPLFETIQKLIYDLRCECLIVLLSQPTKEILASSGFEEQDWIVDRDIDNDSNCCLITNLPIRFEAKVTKALTLSKEYVLDDRKGEKLLFKDNPKFVEKIAMLLYGIFHAFLKRITRFMNREDNLPKFVHMSRSKLLLYLFNDLALCKRKILPNIWNIISSHKYKQITQVIEESKKNVKDLQNSLLKQYMIEAIGPIINSIETNLKVGHFDFNSCSPPITVRNYIKIIIMNLINVHSELFLLNKSLINVVFTYAIKEIYAELLKIFSNVAQFSDNAAIQTNIDLFCLRETFKTYTNDESKELIQKVISLIPTSSFEQNKELMISLIGKFESTMRPYIATMQSAPPTSAISVSFNNNATSTPIKK